MRFAAVQIPAKIGWCSLNGEKLDELHCVALIFGQFAVLHAHTARFFYAGIYKAAVGLNPQDLSLCYPRVPEAHHFSNPRQAERSGVQSGEGLRPTANRGTLAGR